MSADNTGKVPTIDHKPHAAFFRQSGWMMIASIAGGLMTLGVHPINKLIPDAHYTAFVVLLMVVSCLPTMPLQMVLAQQSAQALATGRERQLAGMIRLFWLWTVLVWAVAAVLVFVFRGFIVQHWQLPGTAGLLVTLPLILVSLWVPLFGGVLQGRQDFFWMGWSSILAGTGRLGFAALLVVALGLGASGMMGGTLIGVAFGALIAIWRTRDLWTLPAEPFDRRALLRQVIPLTLGFGACQFLFLSDTLYAKAFFSPEAMKPYAAAGTMSRGMLWLVMPLAAVMFPKIVNSSAKAEKTNLMGIVLLGTALLGACAAVALWLVGPLAVRIIFNPSDVAGTMALIPWYAGAMVPLALAFTLVNDLLARSEFRVVPFMVVLAVGCGFTLPAMLQRFPGRQEVALMTLAAFNVALFAVCAWFEWGARPKGARPGTGAGG